MWGGLTFPLAFLLLKAVYRNLYFGPHILPSFSFSQVVAFLALFSIHSILDNPSRFLLGTPQLLPPFVHLFLYVSSAYADFLSQLLDFLQVVKGCPCALSPFALQGSFPWDPAKLRSVLLDLLTIYWILQNSLH